MTEQLIGWVEQVASGHPEAESAVCDHFAPVLRLYARRRLGPGVEVDDVVQDCLATLVVALRAGRLREPEKLGQFVFGIAKNTIRERRRNHARRQRLDAVVPVETHTEPALVGFRMVLFFCLNQLTERARRVLERSYAADEDSRQIAAAMQLTAANVRVIRHRALGALRRCLEEGQR